MEYNDELKELLNNIGCAIQQCDTPLRQYIDLQVTIIHRIGSGLDHSKYDSQQELYRLRMEE